MSGPDLPIRGCFGKGDVVYFGMGGTAEQMAAAVPAGQERITCVVVSLVEPEPEASEPEEPEAVSPEGKFEETACLTAEECEARGDDLGLFTEFQSGDALPSKGCFSLRGKLYFGTGGTIEETSSPDLPGLRTRVWCLSTSAPTASPTTSSGPTPAPTYEPTSDPTPPPTGSPIDWSELTPGHTRFCGPKVVGGYDIAKASCSPATECGKGEGAATAYGSNGNDCPKGLMCYTEIDCAAPVPTGYPTGSPRPTSSPAESPSVPPSATGGPTPVTREPTFDPTSSSPTEEPSASPVSGLAVNAVTVRGSFCGESFGLAVERCGPGRACASDADCQGSSGRGGTCFGGISCTTREAGATGEAGDVAGGGGSDSGRSDGTGIGKVEEAPPKQVMDGCRGGSRLWRLVGLTVATVSIWTTT